MKSIRLRLRNQRVDPEMWVQLYDSYLRRFALLKIKNAEIAEDLVQETFLAALTSLADFQRRSSVKTWLTGILRNKIMDYYRRSQRELAMENKDLAIISLDEISGGHEHWCAWSNRINYNPANFFEQMEFFEVLNRCLAELPIRLAYIFILHTFLSLSTIEICRELNISKTNCWVMLHRARRLLKVLLQARWISV